MSGTEQMPHAAGLAGPPRASRAGWIVVGATFLATFTSFGVVYSFGAFFRPMADEFGSDRSATAFFFSITTLLYFGIGVVSGRVADRVGPRRVLLVGAGLLVTGLLVTSRVQSLWAGYLTYGVGVGAGVGCAYVPMVAAVSGWFERQRAAALGLAVAGIGVGTLVTVPVTEALVDRHGWRDTYVMLAVAAAVLYAVAAVGARRPPVAAAAPPPVPLRHSIGRNRSFWLLYAAYFLATVPLFVPFVFLKDYITERGVDGSAGLVVGLIGLSSVVGRLGLGAAAARFGTLTVYVASFAVMALSFAVWFAAGTSYALLAAFAVVLGVSYGGFVALSPAVAAELFGPVGLGGILGALYTASGLGGFVGPPLLGAVIDAAGYRPAIVICGVLALAATAVLRLVTGPTDARGPSA